MSEENMIVGSYLVDKNGNKVEVTDAAARAGVEANAQGIAKNAEGIRSLNDDVSAIGNLETVTGEKIAKVTGWTSGRIESGEHKANSAMAYSELLPYCGQTFHFDATVYKFMYIMYDADGNRTFSPGSWIEETPFQLDSTKGPYVRAQVAKLDNSKITTDEFADLPNIITYTAAGESTSNVPIVQTVIELEAANTPRYVNGATGNDDNPGTAEAPFATIQKGVNSGTRLLYVTPGEYKEYVKIEKRDELTIMPTSYPEAYDITAPETPMIHIAGTEDSRIGRAMQILNCGKISITGVWGEYTNYEVFDVRNVKDFTMIGCYASNNAGETSAFKAQNTNAVYRRCKAWNSVRDGFGFTNHGDVRLFDCIAHDCADDGVSHHNSNTGMIVGGEFYNCGKGGVASPTYGSHIDVMGVYSHDNAYGLYAMNEAGRRESVSRICGCVFINNTTTDLRIGDNCRVTGWNNVYNTKSVMDAAIYTEIGASGGV